MKSFVEKLYKIILIHNVLNKVIQNALMHVKYENWSLRAKIAHFKQKYWTPDFYRRFASL